MKNLFFIIFVFATLTVKGQVFAPIGANWYYNEGGFGLSQDYDDCEYIHYQSLKDTIIKGKPVRKIVRKYFQYTGDTLILKPLYVYNTGDSVFLFNPDKDVFGRFFIFNKQKGDTLTLDTPYGDDGFQPTYNKPTYRLVIDSVNIVTFNSKSIKKYKTRGLDNLGYSDNVMDFIGGLDWFFPRGGIIPEDHGYLRCYNDSNFNIKLSTEACDYRLISGISKSENEDVLIYPNPVCNKFYINTSFTVIMYEIYDNIGVLCLQGKQKDIDFSNFETGMYFIKIKLQDNSIICKKIIKNNAH